EGDDNSGEEDTGRSLGGDAAIFKEKIGADLQARGSSAGNGADDTQTANDITITMESLGAGDVAETAGKKWLTPAEQTKLSGVEAGADDVNTFTVAAAGAVMDGDFLTNGIMLRTGAGAYSILADNSANWN